MKLKMIEKALEIGELVGLRRDERPFVLRQEAVPQQVGMAKAQANLACYKYIQNCNVIFLRKGRKQQDLNEGLAFCDSPEYSLQNIVTCKGSVEVNFQSY